MVTLTARPELKPIADEVARRLTGALARRCSRDCYDTPWGISASSPAMDSHPVLACRARGSGS